MATSREYADYVCRQLEGIGTLRILKMFGEYCVYVNEKPIVLCCDNLCYISKHPAIDGLMAGAECGFPYEGAKERYILDIDHSSEARRVVSVLESVTEPPKPKKKKRGDKAASR